MDYTYWAFRPDISYIIHDLDTLGVARKIQVIGFLQVNY